MAKTNAVRILDGLGIKYALREYAVDTQDVSVETVAAKIGLPLDQVFNTLAVWWEPEWNLSRGPCADKELDLKVLAQDTGDRQVDMVP